MKTTKAFLKITLGVFLMTTVAFADNNNPRNIETNAELNGEYVKIVHENSTQSQAKFLSGIISQYDVRNSDKFDSRKDEFQVIFRSKKGIANVIYDKEGRIIRVNKNIKNVAVPKSILKQLSEKYNDYEIVKNKYKETYILGEDLKKIYVLTVQNGKEKKRIRMNG